MNQISDTESEPDQFEPIVETLEKKKKKAKPKKAVPPPDAVEEPEPVVKPKRVYKKKVAVAEPVAEPVPEPVPEPIPVPEKTKRKLTENQLKALAEARERRKADKIQLDETSKQILQEAIEAEKPKRQSRKKAEQEPAPKPKRVYKKKEAEVAPRPKRQLEVESILFV